jgi:hypothetical protein
MAATFSAFRASRRDAIQRRFSTVVANVPALPGSDPRTDHGQRADLTRWDRSYGGRLAKDKFIQ